MGEEVNRQSVKGLVTELADPSNDTACVAQHVVRLKPTFERFLKATYDSEISLFSSMSLKRIAWLQHVISK